MSILNEHFKVNDYFRISTQNCCDNRYTISDQRPKWLLPPLKNSLYTISKVKYNCLSSNSKWNRKTKSNKFNRKLLTKTQKKKKTKKKFLQFILHLRSAFFFTRSYNASSTDFTFVFGSYPNFIASTGSSWLYFIFFPASIVYSDDSAPWMSFSLFSSSSIRVSYLWIYLFLSGLYWRECASVMCVSGG